MADLRALLWRILGPVRSGDAIARARAALDAMAAAGWQARLARALVGAAAQRLESLGAHWREDRPGAMPVECAA
jgi:L-aspartate oxidase